MQKKRNLEVGDYVLDDVQPRGQWPSGVVSQAYPGKDGLVRKVQVALAGKLDNHVRRTGN